MAHETKGSKILLPVKCEQSSHRKSYIETQEKHKKNSGLVAR